MVSVIEYLLFFSFFVGPVLAKLVFSINNSTSSILVYQGLTFHPNSCTSLLDIANEDINNPMPIIDITGNRKIFDYCDINNYAPGKIAPLLKHKGLLETSRFAALMHGKVVDDNCDPVQDLRNYQLSALLLQKLKPSIGIYSLRTPASRFRRLPYTNNAMKTIRGEKMKISSLTTMFDDADKLSKALRTNSTAYIQSIHCDPNPYEIMVDPNEWQKYAFQALSVISLLFAIISFGVFIQSNIKLQYKVCF
jgi:hypothetical protein